MQATNLNYSGKVTVTTSKRKSVIKNSGKSDLFNLICKTLVGYPLLDSELPCFIDLYAYAGDSLIPALIQKVPVTRTYKVINNTPIAVFTASIADTNLIEPANNDSIEKYEATLLDGTYLNRKLATISIERETIDEISPGRQGLIEWELTINNTKE